MYNWCVVKSKHIDLTFDTINCERADPRRECLHDAFGQTTAITRVTNRSPKLYPPSKETSYICSLPDNSPRKNLDDILSSLPL